jgi:hypothetical protein
LNTIELAIQQIILLLKNKPAQMTADLNRFVNIQYCSGNNLPFSIMHPQGRIVNHYTLSGTKLGKMLFDRHGNLSYHVQYFGDLVISDGQPTRILHAESIVNFSGKTSA